MENTENMELSEFERPHFSKWVDKEEKICRESSNDCSEDEIVSGLEVMLRENELTTKLKVYIRQDMHPKRRELLWITASRGVIKYWSDKEHYRDAIQDLGIQFPSNITANIFNRKQSTPSFYLLSPDGATECKNILYVISQVYPDIQFCPLIPPLTALCLHFMEEEEVYCCVSAMLDSDKSYFDKGQASMAVSAKTFQDLLKMYMKRAYKHFKVIIAATRDTAELSKGTVFFPHWISLIFSHLDFWTLVYIVDNFIVQGPKVLIRVGLVVFNLFDKWLTKKHVKTLKDLEETFGQFVAESSLKGYKLMEAAFKIRGLSRQKIGTIKEQNVTLLREGVLEVPFCDDVVKIPTLYRLQGTDILTDNQWEILSSWLPEKLQIKRPFCLFSTQDDGSRIQTLYGKCEKEAETILLVKTSQGEIVGAFCSVPLEERQHGKKTLSYFGTGETFVFSLKDKSQKYSWNGNGDSGEGTNDFFMAGDNSCFMVGGGGDNALWIDGELLHGHSGTSKTFINERLTSEKDFEIVRVEVLGFKS